MGVRNVLEGALARLNKEHLTTTESSNIAAETSHGEDPGDSSFEQIEGTNSKGVEEHLTKTESSNIAAETSHGEDPGDISLAEIDKHNATTQAADVVMDPVSYGDNSTNLSLAETQQN